MTTINPALRAVARIPGSSAGQGGRQRRGTAGRRLKPADEVGPSSIAPLVAKDRAMSPTEIRIMHRVLDTTATLSTIHLALRLCLALDDGRRDQVRHQRETGCKQATTAICRVRPRGRHRSLSGRIASRSGPR
ncbi:MAG: hypothetical protein U1F54_11345 [Burkholderiales bacterium]